MILSPRPLPQDQAAGYIQVLNISNFRQKFANFSIFFIRKLVFSFLNLTIGIIKYYQASFIS